jgi:hypothetical protein
VTSTCSGPLKEAQAKTPILAGGQRHMWQPAAQLLERHSHLHPREALGDAMMAAPAERQMFVGVLTAIVEILPFA